MDVVYFVKDEKENKELKYSVRSVVKNFPHGKIVFVGGCPDDMEPDLHLKIDQVGKTKYEKVHNLIKAAIECDEISDDFYLFNDDFFVLSPVNSLLPMIDGSLWCKVRRLEKKYKGETKYSKRLLATARALRDAGYDRLNYELHVPMVINKEKANEVIKEFGPDIAFRSAYGNRFTKYGMLHPDVKIMSLEKRPDPDLHNVYLSTYDKSFEEGAVGKYIRNKFRKKSDYEK